MIKNVLLDWSGTLADDLGPVLTATNEIFSHYGRAPLTLDQFRHHFRLPFSGFYAELLPEATEEGLEALYERFFHGLNDHVALLPGALDFLKFCQSTNRRMFLLSTIKASHFEMQSTRLGVRHFFEHAYVEIHDKREKIREILKDHDLDPAETIFVGDMVHDIETARHGGVTGVAVLTGFDPIEKLLPSDPPIICKNLDFLRRLLN
jgi:phosphoglycolate phosphatase-like HAD superfamily hydrolase